MPALFLRAAQLYARRFLGLTPLTFLNRSDKSQNIDSYSWALQYIIGFYMSWQHTINVLIKEGKDLEYVDEQLSDNNNSLSNEVKPPYNRMSLPFARLPRSGFLMEYGTR